MDRGEFQRLKEDLEARERSEGLRMAELLELPEPLNGMLAWMMRQGQVTVAELAAYLGAEETSTRDILTILRDTGWVREIETCGLAQYCVHLVPKRRSARPADVKGLEREMKIARQIQASFLPEELPHIPGWEIAARFQPARYVAGDFYDVFPLVQNRRVGLVIGDVCDKGVGAALFMALFRTLIRAFAQQHYAIRWMSDISETGQDPAAEFRRPALPTVGTSALKNAMELTNNYIARTHGSTSMFSTLFFGVLDPSNGMLMYINGGHEYPILVNSTGIKEQLATTGPLVGIIPDARFNIKTVCIEPGDTLVAFTDGVTEAHVKDGELFGSERLCALLSHPFSTASELLDRILASVNEFTGEADPYDDVTLLAVRRQ